MMLCPVKNCLMFCTESLLGTLLPASIPAHPCVPFRVELWRANVQFVTPTSHMKINYISPERLSV